MRPTPLQRKCMLIRYFLNRRNEYPAKTGENIPLLGGITRSGFEKWEKGEADSPRTLMAVSDCIKRTLKLDHPGNLFHDHETGVMELGRILGLSRAECRYAIDQRASEMVPTFSIFSMDEPRARSLANLYRGLYLVYRWENTEQARAYTGREQNIACMSLAVRYSLPGNKAMTRGFFHRIRCKLNVPAYRLAIDLHEYDGHLTPPDSGGLHYWLFETRKEIEQDMVLMMTGEVERTVVGNSQRQFALGTMVSRTQDRIPLPAIWPIVIEQIGTLPDVTDYDDADDPEQKAIQEQVRLLDPDEIDPLILEKLKQAQSFSRTMSP